MRFRKIPEDLECGIVITMKVIGSKWKPCILDAIHQGNRRPSQIQRSIPGAPARVIEMQLKELEQFGIVSKKVFPGKLLRTEYSITETGCTLIPLIKAIEQWGDENRHILQMHPDYKLHHTNSIKQGEVTACVS